LIYIKKIADGYRGKSEFGRQTPITIGGSHKLKAPEKPISFKKNPLHEGICRDSFPFRGIRGRKVKRLCQIA